jgi:protein SCO1/2
MKQYHWILISTLALMLACQSSGPNSKDSLPYLGPQEVDGAHYQVPSKAFVNQDSQWVDPVALRPKVLVADFFFTRCPTICPIMKTQMLRVHDKFQNDTALALLSYSIDPSHDTVAVLKDYAERLGVAGSNWHFLTGIEAEIHEAAGGFLISASADEDAPGGYIHSGAFVLIDQQGHIRGFYDGTEAEEVDQLMADIQKLKE